VYKKGMDTKGRRLTEYKEGDSKKDIMWRNKRYIPKSCCGQPYTSAHNYILYTASQHV